MHVFGGLCYMVEEGQRSQQVAYDSGFMAGSVVLVGTDGYRYQREDELPRHGHMYQNGVWMTVRHPERSFLVYDQTKPTQWKPPAKFPKWNSQKQCRRQPLAELAQTIGAKEDALAQTLADFNKAAAEGHDPALPAKRRKHARIRPRDL